MITREYVVSPEVLEKRDFPFTPCQELLIQAAKAAGKMLRGEFLNTGGQTMIWHLEII